MFTTFVQLPVALDLATIQNLVTLPITNLSIIQLVLWPLVVLLELALTNTNPSGKTSVTFTTVAFTLPTLLTVIVKLTKVLLPTTVKLAVLLIVKSTG